VEVPAGLERVFTVSHSDVLGLQRIGDDVAVLLSLTLTLTLNLLNRLAAIGAECMNTVGLHHTESVSFSSQKLEHESYVCVLVRILPYVKSWAGCVAAVDE